MRGSSNLFTEFRDNVWHNWLKNIGNNFFMKKIYYKWLKNRSWRSDLRIYTYDDVMGTFYVTLLIGFIIGYVTRVILK